MYDNSLSKYVGKNVTEIKSYLNLRFDIDHRFLRDGDTPLSTDFKHDRYNIYYNIDMNVTKITKG